MTYNIKDFKAITPELATKLAGLNIRTMDDFLKVATDGKMMKTLVDKVGLEPTLSDRLVKLAMFTKVDGVKPHFAELLLASGVDSVEKLHAEKPEMLLKKMTEVNATQKLAPELPKLTEVEKWVKSPMPELVTNR